jgi:TonB family protein
VEADIEVALSIDGHGQVQDATIVSSTEPELNDATIDAALRWTFKPARDEGFPVASKVHVPFHFQGNPAARQKTDRTAKTNSAASRSQ